jgi:sugar diacid utilization regulator
MSSPARRLREHGPPRAVPQAGDLLALEPVAAAVEAGAGLPEVLRAAARAVDASMIVSDRSGAVLAVAARSPAEERTLLAGGADVDQLELRVADELVGRLHARSRSGPLSPLVSLVKTLIASEVERVRAPDRASEEAADAFLHALLARQLRDRQDILARAQELGIELDRGGSVVVARALPLVPTDDDWRARVLATAERGARAAAASAIAALDKHADGHFGDVVVLVPGGDNRGAREVADVVLRELQANVPGFAFALGASRLASDPTDLHRAGKEALLAANVAEADGAAAVLAFDDTGAYRLLLPAMSEHPEELQRFYSETVEPLVAYDEQYETELVQTLETFLDCDGNVAQTAQRLFTHRHTIRYRLERARELSGLDVGSSDGREKLSLGLKAMRVLGIAAPRGPATEAGAEAGRVPGVRPKDR